jgi:hypothetical protein
VAFDDADVLGADGGEGCTGGDDDCVGGVAFCAPAGEIKNSDELAQAATATELIFHPRIQNLNHML